MSASAREDATCWCPCGSIMTAVRVLWMGAAFVAPSESYFSVTQSGQFQPISGCVRNLNSFSVYFVGRHARHAHWSQRSHCMI